MLIQPIRANNPNNQLVLANNNNNQVSSSENIFDNSESLSNMSSYAELFPNLVKKSEDFASNISGDSPEIPINPSILEIFTDPIMEELSADPLGFNSRAGYLKTGNVLDKYRTYLNQNPTYSSPIEEIGNMKVKDLLNEVFDPSLITWTSLEQLADLHNISILALRLMTIGFIYSSVVKVYVRTSFPSNIHLTPEQLLQRSKNIRSFMIFAAAPISLSIYTASTFVFRELVTFKIKDIFLSSTDSDIGSSLGASMVPFLFNKTPNWIFLIILLIMVLIYIQPNNILLSVFNFLSIKHFLIFFLVCQVILIIYYLTSWLILTLLIKNQFKLPKELPAKLKSELKNLNDLSLKTKIFTRDLYKRNIVIYIFTFIFVLINVLFIL